MTTQPPRQDLPPLTLYDPENHHHHHHLLPQIATIHRDCVHHDRMLATIHDVDNRPKVLSYWESKHDSIVSGQRILLLQLLPSSTTASKDEVVVVVVVVAGLVMLHMPQTETGPFRSEVEKLMVGPEWRGMGIGRKLMEGLEVEAMRRGRGLMVLDTEKGCGAERLYEGMGWRCFGVVERYGIRPSGGKWEGEGEGELVDGTFWVKDLRG